MVHEERIPTNAGDWSTRAEWILQPQNVFDSVEALKEREEENHTSLGLVRPASVDAVKSRRVSDERRLAFWEEYQRALQQMELPIDATTGRAVKPLRASEYEFFLDFRCADTRCVGRHHMRVLDWEVDALYFNMRYRSGYAEDVAARKTVERLEEICDAYDDTRFFMGNFRGHLQTFGIVGLWYPKKMPVARRLSGL